MSHSLPPKAKSELKELQKYFKDENLEHVYKAFPSLESMTIMPQTHFPSEHPYKLLLGFLPSSSICEPGFRCEVWAGLGLAIHRSKSPNIAPEMKLFLGDVDTDLKTMKFADMDGVDMIEPFQTFWRRTAYVGGSTKRRMDNRRGMLKGLVYWYLLQGAKEMGQRMRVPESIRVFLRSGLVVLREFGGGVVSHAQEGQEGEDQDSGEAEASREAQNFLRKKLREEMSPLQELGCSPRRIPRIEKNHYEPAGLRIRRQYNLHIIEGDQRQQIQGSEYDGNGREDYITIVGPRSEKQSVQIHQKDPEVELEDYTEVFIPSHPDIIEQNRQSPKLICPRGAELNPLFKPTEFKTASKHISELNTGSVIWDKVKRESTPLLNTEKRDQKPLVDSFNGSGTSLPSSHLQNDSPLPTEILMDVLQQQRPALMRKGSISNHRPELKMKDAMQQRVEAWGRFTGLKRKREELEKEESKAWAEVMNQELNFGSLVVENVRSGRYIQSESGRRNEEGSARKPILLD